MNYGIPFDNANGGRKKMNAVQEFDDQFKHEFTMEVPFCMTDFGGGVYHARYLDLYHQGRDAFFVDAGISYKKLMDLEYYLVIVDVHMVYSRAVNFYDKVMIRTKLTGVRDRSFFMVQEIWIKDDDGESLCNRLEVTHVFVSAERKAISIPDFFLDKIVKFQNRT